MPEALINLVPMTCVSNDYEKAISPNYVCSSTDFLKGCFDNSILIHVLIHGVNI
jgi:hypothetical protein